MKKRILSVILCFILLLQTSATFAASYDFVNFEDKLYDDGVDEANGKIYYVAGANTISKKIKFSMDMGLIQEYAPNGSVTKQNIKDALQLVFGFNEFYARYYQNSKDDEVLTVDEAIVLFMDAAGYGKYLELSGRAELADYCVEAQKRGLLEDVDYNKAKEMFTTEMFYTMLYNALDLPVFGGNVYSNEGVEYSFSDETLMASNLGFKKVSGIVTVNSYTSINGADPVDYNRIAIENEEYEYEGLKDVDTFIGYAVEAYVDKDNILRSIAVDEMYNETKIFDDSIEVKDTTTKSNFQYYDEKNKVKTLKLNPYINVVYNHVACPDFNVKDFDVKNGYVKFIDNNDDNVYDVAFVYEYSSFMPYIVYDNQYRIEDIIGNSYDLLAVADEGKYRGMRDMEGKEVDISQININTPVSVLTLYGTRVVTELIFLEENTYEGVYSGYKNETERYKIGEEEFEVTEYFMEEADGEFPHKLGSRILIYLDQFGKIIKSADVENVIKYGYVTGVASGGSAFNSDVSIKMFTENDKWETFDFADSFIYNDKKIQAETVLKGGAKELYDNGAVISQLVRYRANIHNEIVELDTADKSNMSWGAYRENDDFQLNFGGDIGETLRYYAGQMQTFGGKYRLNKAVTKVFNIPTDPSYTDYFRMGVTEIYNGSDYTLNFFDVDENYTSGAICIFRPPVPSWVDGYMSQGRFIIDTGKILEVTTGDVLDYISLSSYNWETSAVADLEICEVHRSGDAEFGGRYLKVNEFTDLRRGDIVELSYNYDGRVTKFMLNFAVDPEMSLEEQTFEVNRKSEQLTSKEWWGKDIITFAKVMSRDVETLVINADKASDFTNRDLNRVITVSPTQSATFYYVGDDKYEYGTFADIQIGDFVLIEMNEITLRNLVVYRP